MPVKKRADLTVREQQFGNSRFWHVKDPVSLRYFQLKAEEYAVLCMLDGNVSLYDLRREFEARFPPQRITLHQLQSFLASLHSNGLVVSSSSGQADILFERGERVRSGKWLRTFMNVLAIRFRGIDPTRFLEWLTPRVRFMFSPTMVALCTLLIVSALAMAAMQFDSLAVKLPRFQEFFSASNLIWLAITLGATKVLHELAHATACRHFGGECHEMGLMFLVFTPCLYCNVSDAWMLPSRWQRVAISAAGMYFELILAAISLFLWWWSVPGFFNAMCLNIVFICSVTTILFNGNPLLRYDGYYILADITEIPNLRQQAHALVQNWLSRFFLGSSISNQRLLPQENRTFLTLWFVAATIYRVLVVWGILWFVFVILEPYGLGALAGLIAIMTITSMLLAPLLRLRAILTNPFGNSNVNWLRLRIRGCLFLAGVAALFLVPLPFSVKAPAVVQLKNSVRAFVTFPGRLEWAIEPGVEVDPTSVVARLSNPQLEREIERLTGDLVLLEKQLTNIERIRIRGGDLAEMLEITKERKQEKEAQLKERKLEFSKLTIAAGASGFVFKPPVVESRNSTDSRDDRLAATWSGTPLDHCNIGASMSTGTEICRIGKPGQFEALLAIDETLIEFVRVGQTVELAIEHLGGKTIGGRIVELADIDLAVAPKELIEHGDFPTRLDEHGVPRPVTTAYQARVEFNASDLDLILRGGGIAKIVVPNQSLGSRMLRFLKQTFRVR